MEANETLTPAARKKIVADIKARWQAGFDQNTAVINSVTNSIASQFYRALIKAVKHDDFDYPENAMYWLCPLRDSLPRLSPLRDQVTWVIDALEYASGIYPEAPAGSYEESDKRLGRKFRAHFAKVAAGIAAWPSKHTTGAPTEAA
jgi:hypothetical protein